MALAVASVGTYYQLDVRRSRCAETKWMSWALTSFAYDFDASHTCLTEQAVKVGSTGQASATLLIGGVIWCALLLREWHWQSPVLVYIASLMLAGLVVPSRSR